MSIKNKFPNIKPSLNLDFANTKRLDPRITFTRASTATYWDGVTQAKAEENLLKYSQDFENAAWTKNGVGITTNGGVAPDGSTTAELLVESTSANDNHRVYQAFTAKANATSTFSIYVKVASGARYAGLRLGVNATSYAHCVFDLSAGTYSLGASATSASIVNVGGGWFRLSVTALNTSGGPDNSLFYISNVATPPATDVTGALYTGDGAAGFYIWGAQLEERSQATAYTPTTDQPITKYQPVLQTAASGAARFDHNPVTGESLGLLIEEQRTNLFTYGQGFDNAAWTKTDATVVSGAAVAPDGAATAFKLIPNAVSTAYHRISQAYSAANNTAYIFSIYAKAAEYSLLLISSGGSGLSGAGGSGPDQTAVVDLANGSILNNKYGVKAVHVGNGWYRCAISVTTDGDGGGIGPYVGVANSATPSAYTGNGYSGIYIWGAQLEAGAFPTSYVPTTTAAVTRAADAASMTGTNFSSWYRQDEGAAIVEGFIPPQADSDAGNYYLSFSDGTISNLIHIADVSGTRSQILTSGVSQFDQILGAEPTSAVKAAVAYKMNDSILSASGVVSPSADTSVVLPVVNRLTIGNRGDNSPGTTANGTIKKIAYYPKRLTNTELQALTA